MAGDLTDDAWQDLYDGIERVLQVGDTSTQRQELARLARVYRRLGDEGRASFLRRAAAHLGVDAEAARLAGTSPATSCRWSRSSSTATSPRCSTWAWSASSGSPGTRRRACSRS